MNSPAPSRASRPIAMPFISAQRAIPRRQFLRGVGVALSLPLLNAMLPAFARAAAPGTATPRRMLAICNNLGLLPEQFFPAQAGRGYALSPYLEPLRAHRDDFTVFSGVSLPEVDGGHPSDICFLTGAPGPGRGGFRNTISLDQFAAEHIGNLTRFPSLTLGVNSTKNLSWTGSGAMLPSDEKASEVFSRLFVQGTPQEVERQVKKLELGKSVLDGVADQAKSLQRSLGARDRERLEQYFTSVRELEKRMGAAREWEHMPKPKTTATAPIDPDNPKAYLEKVRLMYDMARLAFESDSTRLVTLMLDSVSSPAIDVAGTAITDAYHSLSHHGKSAAKLTQLVAIDQEHMKLLAKLLGDLKAGHEGNDTLLDRTMVLYGSNLGNANTHVNTNLPVFFAGGGFKHGQHLAFDRSRNYPLTNLYVSMLQRLGIPSDKFATSTGTMRGLEAGPG